MYNRGHVHLQRCMCTRGTSRWHLDSKTRPIRTRGNDTSGVSLCTVVQGFWKTARQPRGRVLSIHNTEPPTALSADLRQQVGLSSIQPLKPVPSRCCRVSQRQPPSAFNLSRRAGKAVTLPFRNPASLINPLRNSSFPSISVPLFTSAHSALPWLPIFWPRWSHCLI